MKDIEHLLTHGVAEVIVKKHLETRLKNGDKLRVKLGFDPTAPDIHLGHTVVLRKLREFQELGHTVVFIVGDATAKIGDPSGRSKTRPPLSSKEIEANAKTYFDQVGKLLDVKKAEIRRNSEWFSKFGLDDIIRLMASFTVARTLERDDFAKRMKSGVDVLEHELLYPAMQAYDSIMVKADVELGGTDQKFNLLAGRDLQRKMGVPEQDIVTCPLLVGLDGKDKMSKSLGNYIGITEPADEMFGKVMSLPDALMKQYFDFALDHTMPRGEPREVKAALARGIVELFHGLKAATAAEAAFDRTFRDKQAPTDVPVVNLHSLIRANRRMTITELLVAAKLASSNSEARRVIMEGGVKVGGAVIKDPTHHVEIPKAGILIQKGKRHFVKVVSA